MIADADRPGRRTRERRRQADRDFLAKVRGSTLAELRKLEADHASKRAPMWKKVAIARRMKMAGCLCDSIDPSDRPCLVCEASDIMMEAMR